MFSACKYYKNLYQLINFLMFIDSYQVSLWCNYDIDMLIN